MKALFLFLFTLTLAYGDNTNSLDTHMNDTMRRESGINKLTPKEQQKLQEWINSHHTLNSSSPSAKAYQGKGATLSQNIAGGRYIELADDSLWQINPIDVPTSSGWISPVTINVSSNPDSSWPYLLTNTATGSKVTAQSIAALPSRSTSNSVKPIKNKKKMAKKQR